MTEKLQKNQSEEDQKWMKVAMKQAQRAFQQGEIPIGAVLVYKGKQIFKSYNQVELLNDVTAHAEMIAIASAGEHLQSKYLQGVTMYVTLEPCAMCAAAIGWAQISRLVIGASDSKKGYRQTAPDVLHPKCKTTFGLLEEESTTLIHRFFAQRRN